jgi:hypothetical protein
MIQPNYEYRAITKDAAEKRTVEQSFAQSTLGGLQLKQKVIIIISLMQPIFYCGMLCRLQIA